MAGLVPAIHDFCSHTFRLREALVAGHYARREESRVKGAFEQYLLALRKTRVEDKTEHSDRAALETLLQTIADETDVGIHVQHEPKREADKGAPDFKVMKGRLILGYVENKGIDENLNKVLKSEQIKKYLSLSTGRFPHRVGEEGISRRALGG